MAGVTLSRAERCARTKERNARRKRENIEKDAKRKRYTPSEQLARLDFRLGKGQGAVKERIKLLAKQANKELAA
jgi:hypothetical protein